MKKITYTVACAFAMLASSNAIAQQGFGTNRPHKSAAVHIESPNKGLLIPRVALKSDTDNTTIVDPALSLLVYNTSSLGGLRPGYYYNSVEVNQTATPAIGPKWVPFLDASNNTVTAENGLTKVGNAIRLGGTIIDDTKITIDAGKKIMIQGLTQVTSMTDQVIAVGHYQSGHVQVATPKQIVTAGIENDLKLDIYPTGNNNQIVLTSTVNGDAAPVDLKPAIQAGQVKYEVVSADKSVVVTPDNTNPDFIKYDLKVTNTNASIEVGNGIKKDANDNNRVVLGGDLTQDTTIDTKGKAVNILGLSTVANMTDQMVAVGNKDTGLLKVAHPGQIVSNTLVDGSGTDAVYDANLQTNKVDLGGPLTKDATIATGKHKMFISDLEDADIVENRVGNYEVMVVDGTSGELRTANTGQIIDKGLRNGSAINIKYDTTVSSHVVNLGGAVKDRSEIITDDKNILAISGLIKNELAYQNVVTVAANGNLQQTTLNTGVQITTKTDDYPASENDETILVDTDVRSIAITLPDPAGMSGKRFHIKSVGTSHVNTLTIKTESNAVKLDGLDGVTDAIVSSNPYQSWILQTDGTGWFVIGN